MPESDQPVLLELLDVPTLVCALHASPEEARACQRGDIRLAVDPATGLVHNRDFDARRAEYAEGYENSLSVSATFRAYLKSYARDLASRFSLEGATALEIGCGDGEFLEELVEAGAAKAIGFEPSWPASRERSWHEGRCSVIPSPYGPERAHEVEDLGAGLLLSRQVLEHVEDPVGFLASLRGHGTSGPGLVIEVPSGEFMFERGTPWEVVYEHRSYFTADSLNHTLRAAGWEATHHERTFHDQFLSIEARQAAAPPKEDAEPGLPPLVQDWAQACRTRIDRWREEIVERAERGQRLGIWGCGARGVMFLNLVDPAGRIERAIDLNPSKHGRFLPGTAQCVEAPEALQARPVDALILMNPLYEDEIRADLAGLGLAPELLHA